MSEENNTTKTNTQESNTNESQQYQDPVVEFLTRLQFNTEIFEQLDKADKDPELFSHFMQVPDIYVLKNIWHIIANFDPNRNPDCPGIKDHIAWVNLIKWFIIKSTTDPQWLSYLGHFGRLYGGTQHASSYYPIKYSPRFTPNGFFVKGNPTNIEEENKRITNTEDEFAEKDVPKSPEEAFAWKGE